MDQVLSILKTDNGFVIMAGNKSYVVEAKTTNDNKYELEDIGKVLKYVMDELIVACYGKIKGGKINITIIDSGKFMIEPKEE